jgi:beta-phosphoglucomutase-like phosphatase (HAD superfamily)
MTGSIKVAPNIQCLIFDCDGTLVDTMPAHNAAWEAALKSHGVSVPISWLEQFNGVPTLQIVEHINNYFSLNLAPQSFSEIKESMATKLLSKVTAIEPVTTLAKSYHGKLPMGVASGGVYMNVKAALDAVGIWALFDAVLTASDPFPPKPAPDLFLEIANRFGIPPKFCQVFEDGDAGLEAALEAGMVATDIRKFV